MNDKLKQQFKFKKDAQHERKFHAKEHAKELVAEKKRNKIMKGLNASYSGLKFEDLSVFK